MKSLLAAVSLLLLSFTIYHHGWSSYDQDKPIDFEGEVLEFGFENPHGFARIKSEEGKTWLVILAPPSRMVNRGLEKDMLKPGTVAAVEGYPHREKEGEMRAERIIIDGETFELRK